MVYEFLALVILVALFNKGSFHKLSDTEIKWQYMIIASLIVQLTVIFLYKEIPFLDHTFSYWIILSYLMLVCSSWMNRELPGFKLFGAGMLLNFLVIAVNEGRMPVSLDALEWAELNWYIPSLVEGVTKHQPLTEATHLKFLADVIPLKPPLVFSSMVISMGDVFITFGISRFVYKRMVQ